MSLSGNGIGCIATLLIFINILATSVFAGAEEDVTYLKVLEARLAGKQVGLYTTIDDLYYLDEKSLDPVRDFSALVDYYMGSGGSVVLHHFITKRGTAIKGILESKQGVHLSCLPEYKTLCLSLEERDWFIREALKAIDEGVVIQVPE